MKELQIVPTKEANLCCQRATTAKGKILRPSSSAPSSTFPMALFLVLREMREKILEGGEGSREGGGKGGGSTKVSRQGYSWGKKSPQVV